MSAVVNTYGRPFPLPQPARSYGAMPPAHLPIVYRPPQDEQHLRTPIAPRVQHSMPPHAQPSQIPSGARVQRVAPPVRQPHVLQVPVYIERPVLIHRSAEKPLYVDKAVQQTVQTKGNGEHAQLPFRGRQYVSTAPPDANWKLRDCMAMLAGACIEREQDTGIFRTTAAGNIAVSSCMSMFEPASADFDTSSVHKVADGAAADSAGQMSTNVDVGDIGAWSFAAWASSGEFGGAKEKKPFASDSWKRYKAMASRMLFGRRNVLPASALKKSIFPPPSGSVASSLSGRSTPKALPGDVGALPSDALGTSTEAAQAKASSSDLSLFPPTIPSSGCGSSAFGVNTRPRSTVFTGGVVGLFQPGVLQCDPDVQPKASSGQRSAP